MESKIFVKVAVALGILATIIFVVQNSTRDSTRFAKENEWEATHRLHSAISTNFGVQNEGKYPPPIWESILPYVKGPKLSDDLLTRVVYNDRSSNSAEYPGDNIPLLIIKDSEESNRFLVICYDQNVEFSLNRSEFDQIRGSLTTRAWAKLQTL